MKTYKTQVLNELEIVITEDQREANLFAYCRETRDGTLLYLLREGVQFMMRNPINLEEDATTDIYELEEMIQTRIFEGGYHIYISEEIREEIPQIDEPNSDFWENIFHQLD